MTMSNVLQRDTGTEEGRITFFFFSGKNLDKNKWVGCCYIIFRYYRFFYLFWEVVIVL